MGARGPSVDPREQGANGVGGGEGDPGEVFEVGCGVVQRARVLRRNHRQQRQPGDGGTGGVVGADETFGLRPGAGDDDP
jgi:hypothetical protein